MEAEKVLAAKKLILEFRGWEEAGVGRNWFWGKKRAYYKLKGAKINFFSMQPLPYIEAFQYDTSWDWLMLVVEDIEKIHDDFHGYFAVYISSNSCTIQGTRLRTDPKNPHYAYFNDITADTKLEATFICVAQFIKWRKNSTHP